MRSLGVLALAGALCFTSRSRVHASPLAAAAAAKAATAATVAAAGFENDGLTATTTSNAKLTTGWFDSSSSEPIPPTADPFYTAPEDFQRAAPGAILRIRAAPGNLTALLGPDCAAAYHVLYRTRNSQYKPDWAVTTVFLPANPTTTTLNSTTGAGTSNERTTGEEQQLLLSYQVPYDSAFLDASPSYALYGADGAASRQDIGEGLSRGWLVSVPDYEGPLASFTAGVQSGHATIDSVRAVMHAVARGWSSFSSPTQEEEDGVVRLSSSSYSDDDNNNDNATPAGVRFALWGYSGGALASEWAAELQVQYAPELTPAFGGAALGGLTPNVTSVLLSVNGGLEAGLIPPSFLGLASQYPAERAYLLSRLKPDGPRNATGFLAALNYTLDEAIAAYAFQDVGDYLVGGLADLLGPVPTRLTQRDGLMGYHGVPQVPLYVYKAVADAVSVVEDTDALVARYCQGKIECYPLHIPPPTSFHVGTKYTHS